MVRPFFFFYISLAKTLERITVLETKLSYLQTVAPKVGTLLGLLGVLCIPKKLVGDLFGLGRGLAKVQYPSVKKKKGANKA